MKPATPIVQELDFQVVENYIHNYLDSDFITRFIEKMAAVKLADVIKKNPYLFKAKGILTPEGIVSSTLDAYLSSSEETIFGNFIEGLAIEVASYVHGATKSAVTGLDLEITDSLNKIKYLVTIKSGPRWGNSSSRKKLLENFNSAERTLRTSGGLSAWNIVKVEGCTYGKTSGSPLRTGGYYTYCGKQFWELVSCNPDLYKNIIRPLYREDSKKKFEEAKAQAITKLTHSFHQQYVSSEGEILWEKWILKNCG